MIRYSNRFRKEGINVNFVEKSAKELLIATYERGVEGETLSCGTGVTAAALSWHLKNSKNTDNQIEIKAKGGNLSVRFESDGNGGFRNIWLCGKAEMVFRGQYSL
jgi:diaminopimelate epimerase